MIDALKAAIRMAARRGGRAFLVGATALSLAVPPLPATASAPRGVAELLEPLRTARSLLSEKRSHLDPALLGIDGILTQAGAEPDQIAAFVAERIAYAPYRGSMLGANGVAATRRGNSLDQALLLASLLNRGGFESRIVGATLDDDRARRLLARWIGQEYPELLPYRAGTPSAMTIAERVRDLGAVASEASVERDRLLAARERGREHALAAAVIAGVNLSPRDDSAALTKIAADYHWVQYRDAPFSDWVDLHPAFGADGPGAGEPPLPSTFFTDTLPDSLLHRVAIRGYIERRIGGTVQRVPITSELTRPVANLDSAPVTFTIVPLDPPEGEEFEKAKVFIPLVNGVRAPGAMMFDQHGATVDTAVFDMGAPGGMVDLILTFGEKGAQAAGSLDALDFDSGREVSEPGSGELLRVILTIRTDGPGGGRTHERVLFDRENDDGALLAWSDISLAQTLYRHFAFVADAGFPAPARTMGRLIDDLDRRLAADEFDIVNWGRPQTPDLAKARADFIGSELATPGLLHRAFAGLSGPEVAMALQDHVAAPSSPSIVAVVTSPVQSGDRLAARSVVDIVAVPWSTWTRPADADGPILRDPGAMAAFGAAVTLDEAELVGSAALAIAPGFAEASSAWQMLDQAALELTNVREAENAAMAADLKRGHRVVVARTASGETTGAWWSIDPATGLVLGMTRNGGAGELTEYITGLLTVSMSVMGAYMGAKSCSEHPNPDCCVAANVGIGLVAGGMIGFAGGAAVAAATAGATGTAFALGLTRVMLAVEFEAIAAGVMQMIPSDYGLC